MLNRPKTLQLPVLPLLVATILGAGSLAGAQQIGSNDFRISHMGPDGATQYTAMAPAVAYNPLQGEYLVVWHGDDDTAPLMNDDYEIFGQRIGASTGAEIGCRIRISDMGWDASTGFVAALPDVAHDAANNVYLVVWHGEDDQNILPGDELEIYGQLIDGATGTEIGPNDFRISDMGSSSSQYTAMAPAVACNPAANEFLVVWYGDDVLNQNEIHGQRIDALTGAELGINDFRISDMGPDGSTAFGPNYPDVAYDPVHDEYLVVWVADDNTGMLVDGEMEVFGQRIDGSTGIELGTNDFRISDMGPDGNTDYGAYQPAVVHNATHDEYLVVWSGRDDSSPDGLNEIYVQRIDAATGAEVGDNDVAISDMDLAAFPSVAYDAARDEYMAAWYGANAGVGTLVNGESEVFAQRLDGATGAELGHDDVRISDMGTDGDTMYGPIIFSPALANNTTNGEFLAVWSGDDDTGSLVASEHELFGQRLQSGHSPWLDLRHPLAGTHDEPTLVGEGTLIGGSAVTLALTRTLEDTAAWLVVGFAELNAPFKGGVLVPDTSLPGIVMPISTGTSGEVIIDTNWVAGLPAAFTTIFQYWISDPAGPQGFAASNAISGTTLP